MRGRNRLRVALVMAVPGVVLALVAGRAMAQQPAAGVVPPRRVAVFGTVRADVSGEPIPGTAVEVLGEPQQTLSDSTGGYRLIVPAGAHLLRVARLGYEAQVVEVAVGADSAMRLDVSLVPAPVTLAAVSVVATRKAAPDDATRLDPSAWIGTRRFSGERVHNDPAFAGADPLQVVTAAPDAVAAPEAPAALHVRGGAGDQNEVLLDGVPLYNPLHAAGALSALNPDVVSSVTLHAGVAPARFGDAVSGVIAIGTREAPDSAWSRGALESYSVRETVGIPLPWAEGSLLLSGRHSAPDPFVGRNRQASSAASLGDVFGKASLDLPGGRLEVFSLTSGDQVGFDAQASPDTGSTGSAAQATPWNRFAWSTGTQAVVWHSGRDGDGGLEARAWRSGFAATALWAAATGPVRLTSDLNSLGVGADVSWRFVGTAASASFSAEWPHTYYAIHRTAAPAAGDTLSPLLALASAPFVGSVSFEDQWGMGPRWLMSAGVREQVTNGSWDGLEPRVSLRFRPHPRIALLAGYSRMSQAVQSLRNEESVLGTVVGIRLPVATDGRAVPVAHSDQLALAATAEIGAGTALTLDCYARRLSSLLLVAPVTGQPFALDSFARGSGRASGVTLSLEHTGEHLFGHAGYAFSVVRLGAFGPRYHPALPGAHTVTVAVGYRPWSHTVLRAAFWATTGRRTSVLADDIEWGSFGLLAGTGDMAGSPQRILGRLNGARLPAYARLDVGLRQAWRPRLFGRTADFTARLDLSNVLDRANELAIMNPRGAARTSAISMLPRSLTSGVEWAY